jgi:rubrerythrin
MATQKHKPLDDLTYDIVTILHEKSEALEAYDAYIADAQGDPDVAKVFEEIRKHDEEDIEKLRFELGRRLGKEAREGTASPSQDVGRAV